MIKQTVLTTINKREVILKHEFLNDDFCEEAKEHFCNKHNFNPNYMNTFFTSKAIHEYIIDNDIDPVYENEDLDNSKTLKINLLF